MIPIRIFSTLLRMIPIFGIYALSKLRASHLIIAALFFSFGVLYTADDLNVQGIKERIGRLSNASVKFWEVINNVPDKIEHDGDIEDQAPLDGVQIARFK